VPAHWCCSSGVGQEQPGSRTACWQVRKLQRATHRFRRLKSYPVTEGSSSNANFAQSKRCVSLREVTAVATGRTSTQSPREQLQLHNGVYKTVFRLSQTYTQGWFTLRPAIFGPVRSPAWFLHSVSEASRLQAPAHSRRQKKRHGAEMSSSNVCCIPQLAAAVSLPTDGICSGSAYGMVREARPCVAG
jgi:hypothetical protein